MASRSLRLGFSCVLDHLAVLTLPLLLVSPMTARAQDRSPPAKVRSEVLDQVEKELQRLREQANREGHMNVQTSEEIAYYLLVGLTAQRPEAKNLAKAELRAMGLPGDF